MNENHKYMFVGFIMGEGSFTYDSHNNRKNIAPIFNIRMNWSGKPVLEYWHSMIGELGRINPVQGNQELKDGRREKASVKWCINRKEHLLKLINFLDKYSIPEVSPKHRDYAIWKKMVYLYQKRGGSSTDEMKRLARKLSSGRERKNRKVV